MWRNSQIRLLITLLLLLVAAGAQMAHGPSILPVSAARLRAARALADAQASLHNQADELHRLRHKILALLRQRAAAAGLNAAQTRQLLAAFNRKFQARLQKKMMPPGGLLARQYASSFTTAELHALTRFYRAPANRALADRTLAPLLSRQLQLRTRLLNAWRMKGVSAAVNDAMASFPQFEKEPVTGVPGKLPPPARAHINIYPPPGEAAADLQAALARARREHKRILLDFGGNWCYDCHVLDHAFRHSAVTPILRRYFLVVHVNVGEFDHNRRLAARYDVPLRPGVPALAVLSSRGRLLYSQAHGEFEAARSLAPADVARFLRRWTRPAPLHPAPRNQQP